MRLAQKASPSGSGLSLSWALQELRKQLGGDGFSLEGHLHRRPTGSAEARHSEGLSQQSGLSNATPTSSDAASAASARHPLSQTSSQGSAANGARSGAALSVHWAAALEQHCARQHAPHHGHCAPDKSCLKSQQSSFPYLEEAAQLERGLLRRPWAGAGGSDGPASSAVPPAGKKRSRVAAFGQ
ncbi:hypothetical protein ABPG77_008482 [Micractinium sp. CCAP 211/92]